MTNWFKVARADRDRIVTHCGEKSPGALAVWLAFCDLANRNRSPRFRSSGAEISRIAGVSRRTVERIIPLLRNLGMVDWSRTTNPETGGLEANDYHLPTFTPTDIVSEPPPTDCRHPTDKEAVSPCRSYNRKTEKTGKTLILRPASPTAGEVLENGLVEAKPKAGRKMDPCFDALSELDGGPNGLTRRAAQAVGVALADIRHATPGVSPEEIRRRAKNLPLHFPQATCTAFSLAKHWSRCVEAPITDQRRTTPPPPKTAFDQTMDEVDRAIARLEKGPSYD